MTEQTTRDGWDDVRGFALWMLVPLFIGATLDSAAIGTGLGDQAYNSSKTYLDNMLIR